MMRVFQLRHVSRNLPSAEEDSKLGDPIVLIAFLLIGLILAVFLYAIRDWWRGGPTQRWKLSLDSHTNLPFAGLRSRFKGWLRAKERSERGHSRS